MADLPKLDDAIWERLPWPALPERPELEAAYRAAWAIVAAKGVRGALDFRACSGSFFDACFSENVYQWDSCFIAQFAKYAQGAFPDVAEAMSCLDNFYAAQHPDGAIPREISEKGLSCPNKFAEQDHADTAVWWRHGAFTNPPLFAWAEWDYYEATGDDTRLLRVFPVLKRYFEWYTTHRSRPDGTMWWDGFGSGMDNVPRGDAWGWVDYTCQTALDCEHLAKIALLVDEKAVAENAAANYLLLKELVNTTFWNEMKEFYSDVDEDGFWTGSLNVGGYWALLANLAPPERVEPMLRHLLSLREFGREFMVPSLAATEKGYKRGGGYWCGGVWAPTTYMVVRALANVEAGFLAHKIALNHATNVARVLHETGTIWENYSPDAIARGEQAKPDFCGWSALGPITMLIEFVLGIRVEAPLSRVTWHLRLEEKHGIGNLKVGNAIVSMVANYAQGRWQVVAMARGAEVELLVKGATGSATLQLSANPQTVDIA
jgi:glycogen debranching enzyme